MDEPFDNDAIGADNEDDDIFNDDDINDDEVMNEEESKILDPHMKVMSYSQITNHIAKTTKKTFPFLTKYEKTRIIGVRIEQLSRGAKPNVNTKGMTSIREIAEEELRQRKTPFIIMRPLPNGQFEYWKMEEFEKI
jgi:DNA-directed RNA polymerase I, II, and III subunit RPABC2